MPLVATLIANPAGRALHQPLVDKAAQVVGATQADWLAADIACDLALAPGMSPGEALDALRAALDDAPVDCVVQDAGDRRRSILIADMDSTMIDQECIDELADMVGLKEHVAAIHGPCHERRDRVRRARYANGWRCWPGSRLPSWKK